MALSGDKLALFDLQLCAAANALERAARITDEDNDQVAIGRAMAMVDAMFRAHRLEPPDRPRVWPARR